MDQDLSDLLAKVRDGDELAREVLFAHIYDELKQRAAHLLRHERPNHTLQPTALVNELFLKVRPEHFVRSAENERYLFGTCIRAMRQILSDHEKRRTRKKRGGDAKRIALDDVLDGIKAKTLMPCEYAQLSEALDRLASSSPRSYQVISYYLIADMTDAEAAKALECSEKKYKADFRLASARLYEFLTE